MMEQKEYWESVSGTKNFTTSLQKEDFLSLVGKDARILDIGCGYGRTLNELHELGYHDLHGFDISEGMAERGRRLYPFLDLGVMEEGKIGWEDESADAVILFAVLTCIAEDEKQEETIREIERVLKPGGILYINDFLLNNDERNLKRYENFKDRYVYGTFELPEGALVRHHTKEHILSLVKDLETVKCEEITFTTMNGNKSNGIYYFGRKK